MRAITLDLWGTILHQQDPQEKIEKRRGILLGALAAAGYPMELENMRAGFRGARRIIDDEIARTGRDIGPAGRWDVLMEQLGVAPGHLPFETVEHAYVDLTLEFLPPLMEGFRPAMDALSERYRIGLICNTGYTGGAVLREVLEQHDLTSRFEILSFSNEVGWLKPHPRIFEDTLAALGCEPGEVLHIGDTEEADVAGARAFGLRAVRYAPHAAPGEVVSQADAVMHHWDDLEAHLAVL
ncbi:MAG: HAD family hydrolase [Chloroflexota bacterium]